MKVLMLGWEYPPQFCGGLGIVCHDLCEALAKNNIEVTLILPSFIKSPKKTENIKIVQSKNLVKININSLLGPYLTEETYHNRLNNSEKNSIYGPDLFKEVERYTSEINNMVKDLDFDVIHAHDWMTYKAGVALKQKTGKPLILHLHASEFDRSGDKVNQTVYDIERFGFENADLICPVGNFLKKIITEKYSINPDKIKTVHNSTKLTRTTFKEQEKISFADNSKLILFLGRMTFQKGPDYFVSLAKRILDYDENFRFIMIGKGDMKPRLIEKTADLGISDKVLFQESFDKKLNDLAYQSAELFVVPSVSEPFGLTCLEAMNNGTPVLISRNAGVCDIIKNCIKIDFWDIETMAAKVIGLLKYKEAYKELKKNTNHEINNFNWTWDSVAKKCINIYSTLKGDTSW